MSNSITCSRLVQMNKIWAHYDKDHPALCNVSMSVKRGSNYAIVGKSGSGKSTLLRVINGMMSSSSGAVSVDYIHPNPRDKTFRKKMAKIGYIPQNLGLVRNTSVLDNVLIGALPRMFFSSLQETLQFQNPCTGCLILATSICVFTL